MTQIKNNLALLLCAFLSFACGRPGNGEVFVDQERSTLTTGSKLLGSWSRCYESGYNDPAIGSKRVILTFLESGEADEKGESFEDAQCEKAVEGSEWSKTESYFFGPRVKDNPDYKEVIITAKRKEIAIYYLFKIEGDRLFLATGRSLTTKIQNVSEIEDVEEYKKVVKD